MERHICIVGGNFFNKGAEAMTFAVIDQLKKQYPSHKFALIDFFPLINNDEKKKYNFQIFNFSLPKLLLFAHSKGIFFSAKYFAKNLIKKTIGIVPDNEATFKEIHSLLDRCDAIFDISGYGLSSHNQNIFQSFSLMAPAKIAKNYKIPYIILPQTLGPFQFSSYKKRFFKNDFENYIQLPKFIFARESESLKLVSKFRNYNLYKELDIVLQSGKLNIKNILNDLDDFYETGINNYICIIPNVRILSFTTKQKIYSFYKTIIPYFMKHAKNILFLPHAKDDLPLIKELKSDISNGNVFFVEELLSSLELEEIIFKSEITLSSRFHGLVLGLKNDVPCISIGWANKYQELMDYYNLKNYCFGPDILDSPDKFIEKISHFMRQKKELCHILNETNLKIRKNNIFTKYDFI